MDAYERERPPVCSIRRQSGLALQHEMCSPNTPEETAVTADRQLRGIKVTDTLNGHMLSDDEHHLTWVDRMHQMIALLAKRAWWKPVKIQM